jgi:hypothetical protein
MCDRDSGGVVVERSGSAKAATPTHVPRPCSLAYLTAQEVHEPPAALLPKKTNKKVGL